MNRIYLYLLSLSLLLACSGGDSGSGDTPSGGSEYLNVSDIVVNGDQTSATLNISASQNCSWNITWTESWINSVNPYSGRGNGSAEITVSTNPSSRSSRSATIKVSNNSGSIVRTITLTQTANKETLDVSVSSMEFDYKAEIRNVTITSNTHWMITGGANWVSLSTYEGDNNGNISISVDENTSKDPREAVLTITGTSGANKQINIKQSGASYATMTTPQVSNVTQTSAQVSFTYDSNINVTTYGICYSTTDNPTMENDSNISQTATANQGSLSISLSGLTSGTTYYVRAYIINAEGTKYSNCISFTTANSWPGGDDNNRPII